MPATASRPRPRPARPSVVRAAVAAPRRARADGQEARQHLLYTALALFADQGFAKTSTREIAQAAGANLAAIRYYFGDKAGLYTACFREPLGGDAGDLTPLLTAPGLSLDEALHQFLTHYVAPLKQGQIVLQCMRLHMREMLEPSGPWAAELERDIRLPHAALVSVLARHLGVKADDEVHRLAFAITGLGMQLYVTHDFVTAIKPSLLRGPAAIDRWAERLVGYALALVHAERIRRQPT